MAFMQEPRDIDKDRDGRRHHDDACFRPQFTAIEPGRSRKRDLEKMTHRTHPTVARANEKQLSEKQR